MNILAILKVLGVVFCAASVLSTAVIWLLCKYAPECPDPGGDYLS